MHFLEKEPRFVRDVRQTTAAISRKRQARLCYNIVILASLTNEPATTDHAPVRDRRSDTIRTIWLPAFFVLLMTLVIRIYDLDMRVQRWFWDSGEGIWKYTNDPIVTAIYNIGVVPALLMSLLSLGVLLLGIGRQDIARYRKIAAYLTLTTIIGAGIITNAILKAFWGRPRPSQLIEFGGSQNFEPVLVYMSESYGKSFPCGHATMGFFFWSLALAMPRRRHRMRIGIAVFGLVLGIALGWVRAAQGGHFLSDTLWAAAIMWFTSIVLFHRFRLGECRPFIPVQPFRRQVPTWAMLCYAPVIGLAFLLCLLATPYKETTVVVQEAQNWKRITIDTKGELFIKEGDVFQITSTAEGFGVPNSSHRCKKAINAAGDLEITGSQKGYFTELRVAVTVTRPKNCPIKIEPIGQTKCIDTVP